MPKPLKFDPATIRIESNILIPEIQDGDGSKYLILLDRMGVGQSVVLPRRIANCFQMALMGHPTHKIITRRVDPIHTRCWKVEKEFF